MGVVIATVSGAITLLTVTDTGGAVPVAPSASVAMALTVCVPLVASAVFHVAV